MQPYVNHFQTFKKQEIWKWRTFQFCFSKIGRKTLLGPGNSVLERDLWIGDSAQSAWNHAWGSFGGCTVNTVASSLESTRMCGKMHSSRMWPDLWMELDRPEECKSADHIPNLHRSGACIFEQKKLQRQHFLKTNNRLKSLFQRKTVNYRIQFSNVRSLRDAGPGPWWHKELILGQYGHPTNGTNSL